jgi:hypothetical protein
VSIDEQALTTEVRFTGGPFAWRKRFRRYRLRVFATTNVITVLGKYGAEGVYVRVAPDRFRWKGWK